MDEEKKENEGWAAGFFTGKNIILAILAVLMAVNTFMTECTRSSLKIAQDKLDTAAGRLQNQKAILDYMIKQKEFENNLKFRVYEEVKYAISKKDLQVQNMTLLIVNEMMAGDSGFRSKMSKILLGSPNIDTSVKTKIIKIQVAETEFTKNVAATADSPVKNSGKIVIDVFYLEDILQESLPRAKDVVKALRMKYPDAIIQDQKILPRSVNEKKGYRIGANQIRYKNAQKALALEIQAVIESEGIFQLEQLQLLMVRDNASSSNYISIFVRNM